jgi:hypothetical protein
MNRFWSEWTSSYHFALQERIGGQAAIQVLVFVHVSGLSYSIEGQAMSLQKSCQ